MQQPKTQIAKFFRIWLFALLFATTNISNKPAWAFVSSVDRCLAQPQCAGAIAEELAPVIAVVSVTDATVIVATAENGKKTTSEAVAGVAVVDDINLSGILAYRIWQLEQNKQAQERAKQGNYKNFYGKVWPSLQTFSRIY